MKLLNVSAISPKIKLGDILYNEGEILNEINKNMKNNEDVLLFPEYSLTGKLQSLQNTDLILKQSLASLKRLMDKTKFSNTIIAIGIPFKDDNKVYSAGFVFQNGDLLGIVPKNYSKKAKLIDVPQNLGEKIPFGNLLFSSEEYNFSLEFGEDLYKPLSPSDFYGALGADFILNLSSLSYLPSKDDELKSLIKSKVLRSDSSYIYAESSVFESTTDTVNKGRLLIKTEDKLIENKGFSLESDCINTFIDIKKIKNLKTNKDSNLKLKYENDVFPIYKVDFKHYLNEITDSDKVKIKKNPFLKSSEKENNKLFSEILDIQSYGVARRLLSIGIDKAVIGISGGLDSTLALIVLVRAFEILGISNENIITITMPGFGTTGKTLLNSQKVCKSLGTDLREIDIKEASLLHFKDISHDKNIHDNTYENVQVRERTQILMDLANKENAIVIGTGDLSELALGWATFNGDHMSMYGV
ncbi:MAG: NAD(+) synthase, partial [Clostridium sp.]|nr:NAD(+) synthase [Clostridium sp.]